MRILAINLGSTSTKIAVFEEGQAPNANILRHSREDLANFDGIMSQKDYRKKLMENWLLDHGYSLDSFALIAARGGLLRPVEGGIYAVDEQVLLDARSCVYGEHAANLGLIIAGEWQQGYHLPAIFVDAPVTDELSDIARISGFKGIDRGSVFHALNAKRVIRLHCTQSGLDPFKCNFIVAHLGGGISVGAYESLRAIDVNNAVAGDGPFSPERAGGLPSLSVLKLCESFDGDIKKTYSSLYRDGGLQSYFGTNDVARLIEQAKSDPQVQLVLEAMYYNIAKSVGAMAAVLRGQVERILLTGGLCFNQQVHSSIAAQVDWIAPVSVYPGEDELAALYEGGLRYLLGEESAKSYPSI